MAKFPLITEKKLGKNIKLIILSKKTAGFSDTLIEELKKTNKQEKVHLF